jgi:hypothetical protein
MNEGRNLNTMNAIFKQYVKPTKYPKKKKPLLWLHVQFSPYSVKALSLEIQQVFGGECPMSGSQREKIKLQQKGKRCNNRISVLAFLQLHLADPGIY